MPKLVNKELFRLVREGNKTILEQFIADNYADNAWKRVVHEQSGDGVLHVAARHGHTDLIRWLVETKGLDPAAANLDGKTALHEAAHFGQVGCVNCLVQQGVAVDCLKRADWTPLMLACTKQNLQVIKQLVELGANLALKNKDGWTSFHIACREGCAEILNFLLNCDRSMWNTSSKNQRTPLHTAALHGHVEVTRLLLEHGDYPSDPQDSCGSTPLMDASRGGHLEVADILITSNKASLYQEDQTGRSCLHHAAQAGCEPSVRFIVQKHGVDINIKSSVSGITPLHLAAKEGQHLIIPVLVKLGADMKSQDNKGRTALHQACGGQFTECVRILMGLGAVDMPDMNGQKARDLAKKEDIISILENT